MAQDNLDAPTAMIRNLARLLALVYCLGIAATSATPASPIVETLPAQGTNGLVLLSGTANPNGSPATAWFEWGSSTAYGNTTPPDLLGGGTAGVLVTTALGQLTPGIAYHYRLVAPNTAGASSTRDTIYQAPRISLRGANPLTNECHVPFADPGASSMAQPLAIAAGQHFSLALKFDGTVTGWGGTGNGETSIPPTLSNVIAIAAGGYHALALRSDGALVGWGDDREGETRAPPGLNNVVAIAAGMYYSLALRSNGTVLAWGHNAYGSTDLPPGLSNVVAIAAGSFHGLALKANGTVVGWGNNADGEATIPTAMSNVVAIAAGYNHSLALCSGGQVIGWGQTTVPTDLSNVVAIAAGDFYSLALKRDGTVISWGFDFYDQASGATNLNNVTAIAAGGYHALAVEASGALTAWGYDGYGQTDIPANFGGDIRVSGTVNPNAPGTYTLNYAATNSSGSVGTATRTVVVVDTTPPTLELLGSNPLTVPVNTPFVDPGARASDACSGVLTSNIVVNGQVDTTVLGLNTLSYAVMDSSGNTTTTNRIVIVAPRAPFVTTLAATGTNGNASFSATLNPNGAATTAWFEWGTNVLHGNSTSPIFLGDGLTNTLLRVQLAGLTPGVVYHYRAVATNTSGRSNGRDAVYQAPPIVLRGANPMTSECHGPFVDPGPFDITAPQAIAAGSYYSLALKADSTVAAWGSAPTVPASLSNVTAIAAGYIHCLALKADGTVVGWGDNSFGQTNTPAGLSNVVAVSSGWGFSLALQSDGTVVGWGLGAINPPEYDGLHFGQATVPTGLAHVVAIAAGFDSSLALKSDGTVASWGYPQPYLGWLYPYFPGAGPPDDLNDVVAIAAGADFGLALKSDGTVIGWGYSGEGQASIPDGLSDVVGIAAGFYHGLALKSDGTVVGWGDNFYGEATPPAGLSNVIAIAAGAYHSLALKNDGTVVGWGMDPWGETDMPASVTNAIIPIHVAGTVDSNSPGTYALTYTASNSMRIVGTAIRTVVVVDTTPPLLVCPTNQVVEFTSETGATVFFTPTATDACSASVATTCTPPSGTLFPIGTTPVTCTATDASSNTSSCTFLVTVLGARGTKSNVLSQLITLRRTISRTRDRDTLDDAISHLRESLNPHFWADETHLDRRYGVRVFNEEQAAVRLLTEILQDKRSTIPDTMLQAFIHRVVKADRLLAVVAIQDAARAGADTGKLSGAWRDLARGDEEAARGKYDLAIECYQHAWNGAIHVSTRLIIRRINGSQYLELPALPGEKYDIEASTNLTDWATLARGTAGPDGLIRFEDQSARDNRVRFYRAKLTP